MSERCGERCPQCGTRACVAVNGHEPPTDPMDGLFHPHECAGCRVRWPVLVDATWTPNHTETKETR